jgi:predicted MFS family arabinose efflux permease
MAEVTAGVRQSGVREQRATALIFLATGFCIAVWAPLIPFAKARLGIDEAQVGLLLFCLGFGSILAMPITGVMTTRYGCRAIILGGGVLFAASLPLLAIAPSIVTLAISLAIFGAAIGTVDVAMNIQAVMVEKDSGRTMMSGFHGLYSLGGIVGAGGASGLLMLGLTPLGASVSFGALALLVLAVSFTGLLPFGNHDPHAPPLVLPRGFVMFIGLLCFLTFLAEGAILDWSALFLIDERAFDREAAGYGFACFAAAMTLGRLLGNRIVTRFGGFRVMIIGGLISASGFALTVLVPMPVVALLGFVLVGLGASNIVPVLFTAAARQTAMPPSLAIAAVTTLGYAGVLAGPAAIGFVADNSSIGVAFAMLGVAMVFVAASGRVAR